MIEHRIDDGRLAFRVMVVPRSARTKIVGEHNGALRVRLGAAPVDGAANRELIQLLAKTFAVSRSAIRIEGGVSSRSKLVSIESPSADALLAVLKSLA